MSNPVYAEYYFYFMKNRFLNSNPKALNLDTLRNSDKRVTMGVKCNSSLKLNLAEEALIRGMTLSQHVEDLLINKSINKMTSQINNLNKKVMFYENSFLKELFEENIGKVIVYKNKDGAPVNKSIDSIEDVYTVLVNSFQKQPNA